jgi:hypothetical protein
MPGVACAWAGAYLEWCMLGVMHVAGVVNALGGVCLAGAYLEWCMPGVMHALGGVCLAVSCLG